MSPHRRAAGDGPAADTGHGFELVAAALAKHEAAVTRFFDTHRANILCPLYASVDVRRNPDKAAVVDANAFPAGFNNLVPESRASAMVALRRLVGRLHPNARSALLLGENHTRNPAYFANLAALKEILEGAGYATTIASANPDLFPGGATRTTVASPAGPVEIHHVQRGPEHLLAAGKAPDLVVLNNDLADGVPDLLRGLAQPIMPPPIMGWHRRRKHTHFELTCDLARQLGRLAGFDPWLVTAEYASVPDVDFKARHGLDGLARGVDDVIGRVQAKYDAYGIPDEPHVFVKADPGTYGMGIFVAHSGEDVLQLNSKGREGMDRGKGRRKTSMLLVQEGVPSSVRIAGGEAGGGIGSSGTNSGGAAATTPKVSGSFSNPSASSSNPSASSSNPSGGSLSVAEPVLYMVCGRVVGGFHRIHSEKGDRENLNSPGAHFAPFVLDAETHHDTVDPDTARVYNALAELASIATGYERELAFEPSYVLPQLA